MRRTRKGLNFKEARVHSNQDAPHAPGGGNSQTATLPRHITRATSTATV